MSPVVPEKIEFKVALSIPFLNKVQRKFEKLIYNIEKNK